MYSIPKFYSYEDGLETASTPLPGESLEKVLILKMEKEIKSIP